MPDQSPLFSVTTTPADGLVDMSKPSQPKIDWTALAAEAVRMGLTQTQLANPVPVAPQEPTPWTNMAIRMGGGVLGGALGSVLGPVGTAAGAALGTSLASNEIAQPREVAQGTRVGVNPVLGYTEGLTSMLPAGSVTSGPLLRQMPRLAVAGAASNAAASPFLQLAEHGNVTLGGVARDAALGAVAGPVVGGGSAAVVRGAQALPGLATRVAQSPAIQKLAFDETGSVGPREPKMLTGAPEVTDAGWSRIAGESLPAETRGVLDPVPVPVDMAPKGLAPAAAKKNLERTLRFFDRHNVSPELQQQAADILTSGEDYLFQKQRRSGQTWEQLDALASQIIPEVKLPKGSIVSPEETAALRRSAFGLLDKAQDISADVANLPAIEAQVIAGDQAGLAARQSLLDKYGLTDLGQLRLAEKVAVEEAVAAQRSLMGVRSEFGRGLNYLKSLQSARDMGDADFLQQAMKGGAVPQDAINALRVMKTPMERYTFLRGLAKPNAQDYWRWYAMNAYLSGPVTQWRNFMGNAANFGVESVLVHPIAAGIDAVRNPNNRTIHLKENQGAAAGLSSGFLDGVGKGLFYFKNGFTTDDVANNVELPPEVFGGSTAANVVGRTMGAVDQFFRTVGFHMELHRQATTQAIKEGLTGDALSQRISQLVADPTITPDLAKRAQRYATELTYQERNTNDIEGAIVGGAKRAMRGVDNFTQHMAEGAWEHAGLKKLGKFGSATYGLLSFPPSVVIAPFINTPFNILKRAAQYSGGAVMAAKGGDREAMLNAARGAVGMAAMGTAAGLYQQGLITGAAPQGGAEADAFYATKRPYSVKLGDQWVSYQALGPLGAVLGSIANYMQASEANPKDALGKFGQLAGSTGKMIVDSSFLKGMYNLLDAVANAERSGDKFAARTVTGLLPAAGAMRAVRDEIDPTLRAPETMGEQIQAALPGLSDNVAPRIDYTGQEIERPAPILADAKDDPLRTELMRLKMATGDGYLRDPLSAAKGLQTKINTQLKKLGQPARDIPRDVMVRYGKKHGRISATVLGQLVASSAYQRADDAEKRKMIERAKDVITDQVDAAFIQDYLR